MCLAKENEIPEHMMIEGFRWSIGHSTHVIKPSMYRLEYGHRWQSQARNSNNNNNNQQQFPHVRSMMVYDWRCGCVRFLNPSVADDSGLTARVLVRTIMDGSTAVMLLGWPGSKKFHLWINLHQFHPFGAI